MSVFNLHFFAIHSSSRHEKRCRMLERIFCIFHCSRNIRWYTCVCNTWLDFISRRTCTVTNSNITRMHPTLGQYCICILYGFMKHIWFQHVQKKPLIFWCLLWPSKQELEIFIVHILHLSAFKNVLWVIKLQLYAPCFF